LIISLFLCVGSAATSCNGNSFQKENKSKSSPCCFSNSTVTRESFQPPKRTRDFSALSEIFVLNLGAFS
jgi:hypothetical protein